jgi:hypothetical protein
VQANRETISQALETQLAKAKNAYPFKTVSRRARIWSNVTSAEQPVIFLVKVSEAVDQSTWGAARYRLKYFVLCYLRADAQPNVIAEVEINKALDAVDAALLGTPPGEKQKLGGLVENCWIEGDVMIDTGILDQQIVIVVPVSIVTGI